MEGFFAGGYVADLAIALLAAEAALLALWRPGGLRLATSLPFLAAGACLLLALRVALTGGAWWWVARALLGALLTHLADLAVRIARR